MIESFSSCSFYFFLLSSFVFFFFFKFTISFLVWRVVLFPRPSLAFSLPFSPPVFFLFACPFFFSETLSIYIDVLLCLISIKEPFPKQKKKTKQKKKQKILRPLPKQKKKTKKTKKKTRKQQFFLCLLAPFFGTLVPRFSVTSFLFLSLSLFPLLPFLCFFLFIFYHSEILLGRDNFIPFDQGGMESITLFVW